MSLRLLLVFAVTEFLLCLTPGPAVLLVVSQAVKNDFKSSLKGAAGILTANALYFALSALGLGALLMSSATLFQIIKWVGAAYLVFIGLKMLLIRKRIAGTDQDVVTPKRSVRLFSEGLATQLSNPKAIVFFSALLPQFVSKDGSVLAVHSPGYRFARDRVGRIIELWMGGRTRQQDDPQGKVFLVNRPHRRGIPGLRGTRPRCNAKAMNIDED